MRKLPLIVALLTLAVSPLQATAQSGTTLTSHPAPVPFPVIPPSPAPATGNLLQTIQSYGCRVCRRGCVREFKIDCYESERWCRRQFVLCMRECWEFVCR